VSHDTALIPRDKLDLESTQGNTTVATVGFSELQYQEVQLVGPLDEMSREQLIEHALEEGKVGQVLSTRSEDDVPNSDEETWVVDCSRPHADQTIVCAGRVYQRGGLSGIKRKNGQEGGLRVGPERGYSGGT
jgi:hypothetical protein